LSNKHIIGDTLARKKGRSCFQNKCPFIFYIFIYFQRETKQEACTILLLGFKLVLPSLVTVLCGSGYRKGNYEVPAAASAPFTSFCHINERFKVLTCPKI
jgi:hypothetical protein